LDVYGIKTCGTYKKAVKWFQDNSIKINTVNLREHPISFEDMKTFHINSGLDIKKFFNTSGKVYKDLNLKNKYQSMTNEEIYQLLIENPMLIKRPLIVDGSYVRTGFNESEYTEKWLKKEA
jgi:arsenate reductase